MTHSIAFVFINEKCNSKFEDFSAKDKVLQIAKYFKQKYNNTLEEAKKSINEMTEERKLYYENKVLNGAEWKDAESRGNTVNKLLKKEFLIS